MKTLTIRGLPDEVHGRLKKRAKANRRSLNQEVIAELAREYEVEERKAKVERIIASADRFRAGLKRTLSAEEIREAIEEGRA
ncbi:MAG: Arc family DNA-binding protein [Verrucomicrobiales bacterium]|nr:Arc family DNA-binding protein [Verrucomicrobiales bacterium]